MKKKGMKLFFTIEALLCAAMGIFFTPKSPDFTFFLFPFSGIGTFLREMSYSGAAGDAAAWVIFLIIGALPLILGLGLLMRKRLLGADALLPLISGCLYFLLYRCINPGPGLAMTQQVSLGSEIYLAGLALLFWSLVLCWLVIRLVMAVKVSSSARVGRYIQWLLLLLIAVGIASLCGVGVAELASDIRDCVGGGAIAVTLLLFICRKLGTALLIAVLYRALGFCEAMTEDEYGEAALTEAEALAGISQVMLVVTVIAAAAANLLQLICSPLLSNIDVVASVPLFDMVIVLGIMLLARYIAAGRTLKQDNDLFI